MGAACCQSEGVTPASQLATAWKSQVSASGLGDGAYGRLVYRAPNASADDAFLVDVKRKVAFVADGFSWAETVGLRASEILLRNGVEQSWIDEQFQLGTRFKLALFDGDAETVWPADWAGVRRAVETFYTCDIAYRFRQHWPALQNSSWFELEKQSGITIAELDARDGPLTEDNFVASEDIALNARRFLATNLSLNKLFAGTGFTVDARAPGGKGTAEFLTANRPLKSIPAPQVIDVPL